jgi:hypothetical protein
VACMTSDRRNRDDVIRPSHSLICRFEAPLADGEVTGRHSHSTVATKYLCASTCDAHRLVEVKNNVEAMVLGPAPTGSPASHALNVTTLTTNHAFDLNFCLPIYLFLSARVENTTVQCEIPFVYFCRVVRKLYHHQCHDMLGVWF